VNEATLLVLSIKSNQESVLNLIRCVSLTMKLVASTGGAPCSPRNGATE
jgi:hypothetical protein